MQAALDASTLMLSKDAQTLPLNAKIDAMTPAGNTNVTIGLTWGFQVLSPNEPFNAPPSRRISTRSSC